MRNRVGALAMGFALLVFATPWVEVISRAQVWRGKAGVRQHTQPTQLDERESHAPSAPSTQRSPVARHQRSPDQTSIEQARSFARVEGERVGALDANPRATEQRLKRYALTLDAEQAGALLDMAQERSAPGDARLTALALAGWSGWGGKVEEKARRLSAFAIVQGNAPTQLSREVDLAFGALAAEALLELPRQLARVSLLEVAARSANPLAIDRAERALWQLGGRAPSPAKQDESALRRLVSR